MNGRVLFYVQHLLGIGHLRRAEILAKAMAADGLDVTIAYGSRPIAEVPFRGIKLAQLPPATIAGEDFSTLLNDAGQPIDAAWQTKRRTTLLDLHARIDPDVVLLELYPFGRRQFGFELIPLLEAIHATEDRARVACSVRDVLVGTTRPRRAAETIATARRFIDAVLVHGDPALIPFGATFTESSQIADLIRHTGYVVADQASAASGSGEDEVIVSAGGGAVGADLLFTAMQARPLTKLANNIWRFLTGPNLPEPDYRTLEGMAGEGVIVGRFLADFSIRLRTAALSISQAGYNTTMDILTSGVRSVVVPYETESETEQRLRAELLSERGVMAVVPAAELSPSRLAQGVAEALSQRAAPLAVDLSGARTTARLVRDLVAQRMTRR